MAKAVSFIFGIAESFIGLVFDTGFDLFSALFSKGKKTEYTADFIPAGELLSSFNYGFCLTGKKSLSIEHSFSNALVLGGSSSGKSSRILIPSILKMMGKSSLVINDPSGELMAKTSGALHEAGYIVKSLNYSSPGLSERYNPLHRVKSISDIQKIAKIIVVNALGQGKDPFWNMSAESLIALFSKYLVQYTPKEYCNFYNVLHLINTFGYAPEKIDRLIIQTNDQALIAEYKAFVAYGDKTLMGIVATCRAALTVFSDPSVASVTADDSIDFEQFRNEKIALFINNSIKDMRYYSVISSIFFEQFWGAIMSRIPSNNELPIFFLLDEASSLYLSSLPVTVSNIRKSKSGILLVYQSYNQIADNYGSQQAKNIAANCFSKVYMPGQPIEIAQELETTFGKFEYTDEKNIRHIRPLMTADEIRQAEEVLILCGNYPPIKTTATPYFEQFKLNRLSNKEPFRSYNPNNPAIPKLIELIEE
jgi:type IV secretory pathway TraG/TraD family ATPase VirD4